MSSFKLLRAEATVLRACCRGNGRCSVQISARPHYSEIVRGFYSVYKEYSATVFCYFFLPHTSQFIIHYHLVILHRSQSRNEIWNLTYTEPRKLTCNYAGLSLLSTTHKITFSILLLIPYADEIIGNHQSGFRCHSSVIDNLFYIHQILEKNVNKMGQYTGYL